MPNTNREKYDEKKLWVFCKKQKVFLPFPKEYNQKLKKLKQSPNPQE